MIKLTAPTKLNNNSPLTFNSPLLSNPNVEFLVCQNIISLILFDLANIAAVFKLGNSLDIGDPKTSKFFPPHHYHVYKVD